MILLVCLLSLALSFVLTPLVIGVSWRIGAVDVPCDGRRMHCQSIPRAGGLAIFVAFFIACLVSGEFNHALAVILGGGGLMLLVGLADDVFCLPASIKLFFQIAAAVACVVAGGEQSPIKAVWQVLWVLLLTNAHNFIDGLDGLFSGCAAIEGVGLFFALAVGGNTVWGGAPLFLAMACIGFRYFNRYPADIFAGDCGSATSGFLLGLLSLPLFETSPMGLSWLSPLFLFLYPLTDLVLAVLRRVLRGKSPFTADRGHLHHRICDAGLLQPQCVGLLSLLTAGAAAVAILLSVESLHHLASFALVGLAFLLTRIRKFVEDFR